MARHVLGSLGDLERSNASHRATRRNLAFGWELGTTVIGRQLATLGERATDWSLARCRSTAPESNHLVVVDMSGAAAIRCRVYGWHGLSNNSGRALLDDPTAYITAT
jgi:hypothetical protein